MVKPNPAHPTTVSRRGLFTAGLAAGLAGGTSVLLGGAPAHAQVAGPDDQPHYHGVKPGTELDLESGATAAPDPDQLAPLAMTSRSSIGGAALYYEVNQAKVNFTFEDGFYNQLNSWRGPLGGYVPAAWGGSPTRIYSYGAYVNKPGYHGLGRAFDIASVYFTTSAGQLVKRFDCRYDQWRNSSNVAHWRRMYWALSASLHHRFRHVLTYLYDANHHNHIHVDNAIYGRYQDALFNTGSGAQVQHVQAVCRYVWGYSTAIDSIWGPQTQGHSTEVLRRYGVTSGTIVGNNYNWRMFNYASLLHGTGKQSF